MKFKYLNRYIREVLYYNSDAIDGFNFDSENCFLVSWFQAVKGWDFLESDISLIRNAD